MLLEMVSIVVTTYPTFFMYAFRYNNLVQFVV